MIDEETKIITPAVYTKRNGRVSMINRNADFDVYEQIEINNGSVSKDYTFIRSYKIRDKRQENRFFLWQYQIVKQIFSHIPILHIKPTKP